MYWCPRCRKDVGSFHRCFMGPRGIRPRLHAPDPATSVSGRLIVRLKSMPELVSYLSADARCERLYHGRHQRAAGAWSWHVVQDRPGDIGSQWSMSQLLRAQHLSASVEYGSWNIDPAPGEDLDVVFGRDKFVF